MSYTNVYKHKKCLRIESHHIYNASLIILLLHVSDVVDYGVSRDRLYRDTYVVNSENVSNDNTLICKFLLCYVYVFLKYIFY